MGAGGNTTPTFAQFLRRSFGQQKSVAALQKSVPLPDVRGFEREGPTWGWGEVGGVLVGILPLEK